MRTRTYAELRLEAPIAIMFVVLCLAVGAVRVALRAELARSGYAEPSVREMSCGRCAANYIRKSGVVNSCGNTLSQGKKAP
jgi:hypothetical protein